MTMEKLSRKEKNEINRKLVMNAMLEEPNMTYNKASKLLGVPLHVTKEVHDGLVSSKLIKRRGYAQFTETRKTRVPMNELLENRILKAFKKYPNLSISAIANKTKTSHGACYTLHDKFVETGLMETRRTVRTKVANEPPLYIIKTTLWSIFRTNKSMTISEAAEVLGISYTYACVLHDELVEENKIVNRKAHVVKAVEKAKLKKKLIKTFNSKVNSGKNITELAAKLNMTYVKLRLLHNELVAEGEIKSRIKQAK